MSLHGFLLLALGAALAGYLGLGFFGYAAAGAFSGLWLSQMWRATRQQRRAAAAVRSSLQDLEHFDDGDHPWTHQAFRGRLEGVEVEHTASVDGNRALILLGDAVPPIRELAGLPHALAPVGVETGDPRFDRWVLLDADPDRWLPILDAPTRAMFCAQGEALGYDEERHGLLIAASPLDAEALAAAVPEMTRFAAQLRARAVLDPAEALAQMVRSDPVPGVQDQAIRMLWRLDTPRALAEGREHPSRSVRYFIATASTPPDVELIEATARDPGGDVALRSEAARRWHQLGGPDDEVADILITLLEDEAAVFALRTLGHPRHLRALGAARAGPHGEGVAAAIAAIRDRFELEGGSLTIAAAEAGGLSVAAGGQLSQPEE